MPKKKAIKAVKAKKFWAIVRDGAFNCDLLFERKAQAAESLWERDGEEIRRVEIRVIA